MRPYLLAVRCEGTCDHRTCRQRIEQSIVLLVPIGVVMQVAFVFVDSSHTFSSVEADDNYTSVSLPMRQLMLVLCSW